MGASCWFYAALDVRTVDVAGETRINGTAGMEFRGFIQEFVNRHAGQKESHPGREGFGYKSQNYGALFFGEIEPAFSLHPETYSSCSVRCSYGLPLSVTTLGVG